MKKLCTINNPKCAKWRFWSDCANAQTDLNLHWAHMSGGTFSHVVAHITFVFLSCRKNFLGTQKPVRISHGKRTSVFELLRFYCISANTIFSWLVSVIRETVIQEVRFSKGENKISRRQRKSARIIYCLLFFIPEYIMDKVCYWINIRNWHAVLFKLINL